MAQRPEMRASDVDRDRVAAVLREHTAEGRISMDEFNERLEELYRSKTYGELARLTADLPDVDLRNRPAKIEEQQQTVAPRGMHSGLKAAWGVWAIASSVNWVIWLIVSTTSDGGFTYPWPVWVMGPWGVVLLVTTLFGSGEEQK